jgi:hypothetical protein
MAIGGGGGDPDMAEWTVPLYLWASPLDTALLPGPPSDYLSGDDLPGNYSLAAAAPLAFAHELVAAATYTLVTLRLYWSASRGDLQTTTWSLVELNARTGGGDYAWVADLGCLVSTPGAGTSAHGFVPLTVSFDNATLDSATAPLSFGDLNLLLPLENPGTATYRQGPKPAITGFAATNEAGGGGSGDGSGDGNSDCASSGLCIMSMSETFPSAGGADCAYACNPGTSCLTVTYDLGALGTPAAEGFSEAMTTAGGVLLGFDPAAVVTPLSPGTHLHMSLLYSCCYSSADQLAIKRVLAQDVAWPDPPLNVTFDKPAWRIDSNAATVDHYSIIVPLDAPSQALMFGLVGSVEAAVRAAGLDVHVPRSLQEPFHATLGVVTGSSYPAAAALKAVNAAVSPGAAWTPNGPLAIGKP